MFVLLIHMYMFTFHSRLRYTLDVLNYMVENHDVGTR